MKVLCQNHTFSLCASTCVFLCCISSLSSVADVTVDLVQINRLHNALRYVIICTAVLSS